MASGANIRAMRWSPEVVAASLASNTLGLALPLVTIQLYDRVIPNRGYETLIVLAMGLGFALIADAALKLARGALMAQAGARYEMRSNAAAVRVLLTDTTIDGTAPGVLYNQISNIDRVRRFHTGDAGAALLDVPFILLFLGVITWISPIMGTTVTLLVAGVFVTVRMTRRKIVQLTNERFERDGRRQSFLIETLGGFESIKALGAEPFMERRYERLLAGSAPISAALAAKVQMTQGITGAVGVLAPVVTAGVGGFLVLQDQLTVGALAAMVLLTGRIVQPALRLEALMVGDEDIRSLEKTLKPLISSPAQQQHRKTLENVETVQMIWDDDTSDPDAGNDPIHQDHDMSRVTHLTLRAGDCVSITGAEGAGRSSLLSAIAGRSVFHGVQIAINNRPLSDYEPSTLTEQIALIDREGIALSGSLLENLTRFQPDIYRTRALELVTELGIDRFVARHAKGLDLHLGGVARGELPTAISDLVHIIAGLVPDPDVILFDQANAALDSDTDIRLRRLLGRVQPDKIMIIVSDRPEYRALANRHFQIEKGVLSPAPQPPALDLGRYARVVA